MVRLFRTEARTRLVDTFLRRFDSTLTAEEIAESAGVDTVTVHRHVDVLVNMGLVDDVGKGSSRAFRLNTESEVTQALGQTQQKLLEQSQAIPPVDEDEGREDLSLSSQSKLAAFEELLPEHVTLSLLEKCLRQSESFRRELVDLIRRHLPIISDHDSDDKGDRTAGEEDSERVEVIGTRRRAAAAAQGINEEISRTEEIEIEA